VVSEKEIFKISEAELAIEAILNEFQNQTKF
jgi:hypothetical protein